MDSQSFTLDDLQAPPARDPPSTAATTLTVLTSQKRTGKSYSLRDGALQKTSVATAKGRAISVPVGSTQDLAALLNEVTGDPSAVLIPGHFIGNDGEQPFDIVFEKELGELLGKPLGDVALAGVHAINGRRVAARLKRSIEPCVWQLLDFDTPEGMPPDFAGLDIAGRLALLEKVVLGISTCERIECRSSTARIVKPGGAPGRASHAWVRLSDPALVETLRLHIHVEAELHGLSFLSPRRSTKTDKTIGQSRLTLFDLSVLIRGRIVFCSSPTITRAMAQDGWSVADAGVTIVNRGAGALDISHIAKPAPERLKTYREKTGERLNVSGHGASLAVVSRGLLTLDTPIETDRAPSVETLGDAVKWLRDQPKETRQRCQTPFRTSVSEAAFIRLDTRGEPFLHDVGATTTYRLAESSSEPPPAGGTLPDHVTYDDFVAYMVQGKFIYTPSGQLWPATSVNARLPWFGKTRPSEWLAQNRPVEQMTWMPGEPAIIQGRLIVEGGWIPRPGARAYNLYKPPKLEPGEADEAGQWCDLVRKIWPDEAEHLFDYFAHRVQHPDDKINHALLLGGSPGIGKDTVLAALLQAVGPWNVQSISPPAFTKDFNGYARAIVLVINEARDSEYDRYQFYEHMKIYAAAPPAVLRVNEKYMGEYYVPNLCAPIITTNHKTNGIYLPAEDRRHFVAWSDLSEADFTAAYWSRIWGWYDAGGFGHVAAWLARRDLSAFNAKAPPPKTAAFWNIVNYGRAPEDAELADALDKLGNPAVTTLDDVERHAAGSFVLWMHDRRSRRVIPYRFEECGYVSVPNPDNKQGLWVINGRRQVVYGRRDLDQRALIAHTQLIMKQGKKP